MILETFRYVETKHAIRMKSSTKCGVSTLSSRAVSSRAPAEDSALTCPGKAVVLVAASVSRAEVLSRKPVVLSIKSAPSPNVALEPERALICVWAGEQAAVAAGAEAAGRDRVQP
jgi:hypothetical protein